MSEERKTYMTYLANLRVEATEHYAVMARKITIVVLSSIFIGLVVGVVAACVFSRTAPLFGILATMGVGGWWCVRNNSDMTASDWPR